MARPSGATQKNSSIGGMSPASFEIAIVDCFGETTDCHLASWFQLSLYIETKFANLRTDFA